MGEIPVSVVGSKTPNWFDTHQIPKNAAYAIPDEAATRLMTASLDVTDPTAATRVVSDAVDHFGRIDVLVNNAGYGLITRLRKCRLNKSTSTERKPPVHLPVGADAVQLVEQHHNFLKHEADHRERVHKRLHAQAAALGLRLVPAAVVP